MGLALAAPRGLALGLLSLAALAPASFAQMVREGQPATLVMQQDGEPGQGLLGKVQPSEPTQTQLAEIVARLGSDDWATRDGATRELATADVSLADIERLLRTQGLSPEQRMRLESVGYVSFASSDRGALGVSFSPLQGRDGVTIGRREPGFDSEKVLRTGDIMLRIDGNIVRDLPDVREHVVTKDPGEFVALDIVRDGEDQQVLVRLGSFRSLRNTQPLTADTLRLAWESRVRRVLAGEANMQEQGASIVRVPSLGQGDGDAQPVLVSFDQRGVRERLAREGIPTPEPQAPSGVAGGKHLRVAREATELFRLNTPDMDERADAALKNLEDQARTWEAQRRRLRERLNEPNLPERDRDRLKNAVAQAEFGLAEVQRQIKLLQTESGQRGNPRPVGEADEDGP
jgi:hypothetical protein